MCVRIDTLFTEDFGKRSSELFAEFDDVPVAAASLAQVYKARTHDGKEVAVKAQYIDLQDRYEGDIGTVQFLLTMVAWMHPKFKLAWIFKVRRRRGLQNRHTPLPHPHQGFIQDFFWGRKFRKEGGRT